MKRTINFIIDNPSTIIPELEGRTDLRMVLWAGDCVHNGITDIERLPNFDVYLCFGFSQTIGANIDYIYNRSKPGIICIIDASVKEQMARFIEIFRGCFSVIDSDYNGNTPTLPREYYDTLLSEHGRAFNVKGINGCSFPLEDVQNALELFAPMLSQEDNYRRTWTRELIDIAEGNKLSPSAAWTSPDFKDPYYNGVRQAQEQLMKWNKDRNPFSGQIHNYSKDNIEEYWKLLPLHILTIDFERNNVYDNIYKPYSTLCLERFRSFIIEHIIPMIKNPEEFRQYSSDFSIKKLQECYRLCKEYPGIEFGLIEDNRRGGEIYGHWICRR
jgi:hypothetical protein